MKHFSRIHFAALVLMMALYVAVRLWGLTASCLWFDEIFSVHAAEHSWGSLLSFVALDLIHPPLFYVLLKLWIGAGGDSLAWLRLFPILFAVIAVFPFIKLCVELKLAFWTRWLAIWFFAVNGSLIKYSQEVRMYSLLLCVSLFSMWLFARYFIKGKGLVPLIVVNVLLVWTHYFGWFVVISEVAAIVIFQRIKWRAIAAMLAVTLASFVPWTVAVLQAAQAGSGVGQNIGWMTRPGPLAVTQLKLSLIEPFYYQASNIDPVSIYRVSVPLLLIAALSVVMYLANWNRRDADERRAVYLSAMFAGLPMIAAFALSWILPYSIWGARHLIVVFAPVSILVAVAIGSMTGDRLRAAAMTLIVLFTGYAFLLRALRPDPQYIWCAWEQLAGKIDTAGGARIYALEDVIAYHLWFAMRNNAGVKVYKLEAGGPEDAAYFLPRGFDGVPHVTAPDLNGPDIWLAYRVPAASDASAPVDLSHSGYRETERHEIDLQGTRALLLRFQK